jgi:adenosylhomocysteinase
MSEIRDIALAPSGEKKIAWAARNMPVLSELAGAFAKEKPFAGIRVSLSIHLEAKTAYLCRVLQMGGAQMAVTGSNPLSTQDDVAAALAERGMEVYAWHGATAKEYNRHISMALSHKPHIVLDDGADLSAALHSADAKKAAHVIGACEETTTGLMRFRAWQREGALRYPVIAVNDADSKHLFDNRYGTGQSVWDGIMRTTNLIVAGKTVVIAGYGWCGKGVALRAKGLGAKVVVTEIDPIRAMEAAMDGFDVMPMDDAASLGDLFITVTGCEDVITKRHFLKMKDGALLSNAGHFNVEVNAAQLEDMAQNTYCARNNIMAYDLSGRTLYLLAEGRLVNLAAGDGHPAEIMDMSFALQALSAQHLIENKGKLENKVQAVPGCIDRRVAKLKLKAQGIAIDALTDAQKKYMYGDAYEDPDQ